MDFEDIFGAAASAASILCQLVGLQLCFQIVQRGGTELISPVPFITFFINACLWVKYGILQNNFNVTLTNSVGAILQLMYMVIYYNYTKKKSQFHQMLTLAVLVLFSPLLYLRYLQHDLAVASFHLGTMCCVMTVCCYVSPMASMRDVCRTKSVETMSFMLVMFNFIAALCWFCYGTLLKDSFVALPNFVGLLFGVVQLSLFCVYPSSSRHKEKTFLPTLVA